MSQLKHLGSFLLKKLPLGITAAQNDAPDPQIETPSLKNGTPAPPTGAKTEPKRATDVHTARKNAPTRLQLVSKAPASHRNRKE